MIDINQIESPDFSKLPASDPKRRQRLDSAFRLLCWAITFATLSILVVLLVAIVSKALPVFQPRPDVAESQILLSIVQGSNESNSLDALDQGDFLQGIFITNEMVVGGLFNEDDVVFGTENPRIGVFSFELAQNATNSQRFQCLPASGINNVLEMIKDAGFNLDDGMSVQAKSNSSIAIFESAVAFNIDDLKGNNGLVTDGRIANIIDSATGWRCPLVLGNSQANDFCQLDISKLVMGDVTGESVALKKINKLRPRKKMGQLSGIFSATKNTNDDHTFLPIKHRSPENELVDGHFVLKADEGQLTGLLKRKKRGFQFGGEFNLTSNPSPDQGTAVDHFKAFTTQTPKTNPSEAGIGPALSGTLWVCIGCALFALPLGIGTAICLEEFKPKNKFLSKLHGLVQLNISNLAGVPSIVYGIVGLTAFGTMFGMFGSPKNPAFEFGAQHYFQYESEGERILKIPSVPGSGDGQENWLAPTLTQDMNVLLGGEWVKLNVLQDGQDLPADEAVLDRTLHYQAEGGPTSVKPWYYLQLPFGRGVLAASLTLMLVILPVIIIATQESLRAVPSTLRQGALGLGSTRWQTVRNVTLPAAIPGIMTGAILAMSRAIGEAAPIIVLAGIVYITAGPENLMDSYSVLPIQIFHWAGLPIDNAATVNWQHVASAGIVVLLAILFTFNTLAIVIRQRTQKPLS